VCAFEGKVELGWGRDSNSKGQQAIRTEAKLKCMSTFELTERSPFRSLDSQWVSAQLMGPQMDLQQSRDGLWTVHWCVLGSHVGAVKKNWHVDLRNLALPRLETDRCLQ
jgi:hypothetical protein